MKYVINSCYGGFGLSDEAYGWLIENKGWRVVPPEIDVGPMYNDEVMKLVAQGYKLYRDRNPISSFGTIHMLEYGYDLEFRSNPDVVECVETLGAKANGSFAALRIVECDVSVEDIEISDYDGVENLQTIPTRF